jgi:hypothetical protein
MVSFDHGWRESSRPDTKGNAMTDLSNELCELSIDELGAVSGGANKTPFQAVYEGLIQGFVEAGGKVSCDLDGHGGVSCTFKP